MQKLREENENLKSLATEKQMGQVGVKVWLMSHDHHVTRWCCFLKGLGAT